MIKARTKLDEERLKKKQESDAQNYLDAVAQPDEAKAADAVIEAQDQVEKQAEEDRLKKIADMEMSLRYTRRDYALKVAQITNEMAKHIDLPAGYIYKINFNEYKLNIMVMSPDGKFFGRGIKFCGNSDYDFHAIGVLLTQCENTVDKLESRGAFNKSGIVIPQ